MRRPEVALLGNLQRTLIVHRTVSAAGRFTDAIGDIDSGAANPGQHVASAHAIRRVALARG